MIVVVANLFIGIKVYRALQRKRMDRRNASSQRSGDLEAESVGTGLMEGKQ